MLTNDGELLNTDYLVNNGKIPPRLQLVFEVQLHSHEGHASQPRLIGHWVYD